MVNFLFFCLSVIGACIGFLWFNAYPAKVFMGDVGSLSLGAAIGTLAVLLKKKFDNNWWCICYRVTFCYYSSIIF